MEEVVGSIPTRSTKIHPGYSCGHRSNEGWPGGTAKDSQDTMQFSALTGVRPMIERYPLEKAADAYQQMMSGKARFRVVLIMGG